MILVKKIEINFKSLENHYRPQLQACYLTISNTENTHYCRTVPCLRGKMSWSFHRESVRIYRSEGHLEVKLKLIAYQSCKTIGEFQLELSESSSNGSTRKIAKFFECKNGEISIYIQYSFERPQVTKKTSLAENFERLGKRKNTANQYNSSPHLLQKVSSMKLIPYKERQCQNIRSFYSPKKIAENDTKVYRQCKDTKLQQNPLLKYTSSFNVIE